MTLSGLAVKPGQTAAALWRNSSVAGSGDSGATGNYLLAVDVQRRSGRHHDLQLRTQLERFGHNRCRREHLLKIVE